MLSDHLKDCKCRFCLMFPLFKIHLFASVDPRSISILRYAETYSPSSLGVDRLPLTPISASR